MIVGLQTYRRVRLQMTGTVESFVIFFQPTALHRIFSLPMHEFDQHGPRRARCPWLTGFMSWRSV